jgi:ribosomal protein L11 methyltransferase
MRVLDVGTGTGVLAIAALKLGAGSALATDIDDVALRIAARLARQHGVLLRLGRRARGRFDLVLANLPLEAQSGLARHLAPGGILISSGFLAGLPAEEQHPQLRVVAKKEQSGWGLVRLCARDDRL